jgi:ubiquinone/menaquinone biosynthesis C-methylase UbiE
VLQARAGAGAGAGDDEMCAPGSSTKVSASSSNVDEKTVRGFGQEWSAFDQTGLSADEQQRLFEAYFSIFPWNSLPPRAEGFDLGCGSGRWAELLAPRVGLLHCLDPAREALEVCCRRLSSAGNVDFHVAAADNIPLADGSQDFGYSLGVLHHVPDTAQALRDAVRKLRSGAPFLVYLYYDFENRPAWFRLLWKLSDLGRSAIARLPFPLKKATTDLIAAFVYWPLSRFARLLEGAGYDVLNVPLAAYRRLSFYSLRTDALDRFGTRLEQRFSRSAVEKMMEDAGLEQIRFRNDEPFWCACGYRAAEAVKRAAENDDSEAAG